MASSKEASIEVIERPDGDDGLTIAVDGDGEFGGLEGRQELERKLIRKIDLRMSILIVLYSLNYVRFFSPACLATSDIISLSWIVTISGKPLCSHD